MTFEEEIKSLIALKREGSYWDFKKQWYDEVKECDKLIDIICMANNLVNRDCYIIIGVDENKNFEINDVSKDPCRRNTLALVEFLRSKPFSNGICPVVSVKCVNMKQGIIDVIVVHNSKNTPFFLTKEYKTKYKTLPPGTVYVRYQDGNTPYNQSAEINHIEYLWKKRFGLDLSPKERMTLLLSDLTKWNCDWGNKNYAYHEDFPEFKLVKSEHSQQGWYPVAAFYTAPEMQIYQLFFMYHDTILFETELWCLDCFRKYLPKANTYYVKEIKDYFWYSYYLLDSIEGKLLGLFTKNTLSLASQEPDYHQILIFSSQEEKNEFDKYFLEHFDTYGDDDIKSEYQHILARDCKDNGGGFSFSAFHVAKTAKIYNDWLKTIYIIKLDKIKLSNERYRIGYLPIINKYVLAQDVFTPRHEHYFRYYEITQKDYNASDIEFFNNLAEEFSMACCSHNNFLFSERIIENNDEQSKLLNKVCPQKK